MPIAEDTMQVNERKSEPSGAVIAADLEIQFFKLFSRFEFALKKAGYLRVRAGRISAHWDKFASDIGVRFFDVVKEIHVADTIIQQPPNKQVVDEGVNWVGKLVNRLRIPSIYSSRSAESETTCSTVENTRTPSTTETRNCYRKASRYLDWLSKPTIW